MATLVQVAVVDPAVGTGPFEAVSAELVEIEDQLSAFRPTSDLGRLHAAPENWLPIGPHLEPVLKAAERVRTLSGGAFDVFSGDRAEPGIAFRGPAGRREARLAAGLRVDLGGIAKGYAADRVAQCCGSARGVMVSIGGSSVSLRGQSSSGRDWRVALRSPWLGQADPIGHLELPAGTLSVSGVNGCRIGAGRISPAHVRDPRGQGAVWTDLASVAVWGAEGMWCEAWSTALLVLGFEEGLDQCLPHGIEAVFLTVDGQVRSTEGMAELVLLRRGWSGS